MEEGITIYTNPKNGRHYCGNCGMPFDLQMMEDEELKQIHLDFHKRLRGKYLVSAKNTEAVIK